MSDPMTPPAGPEDDGAVRSDFDEARERLASPAGPEGMGEEEVARLRRIHNGGASDLSICHPECEVRRLLATLDRERELRERAERERDHAKEMETSAVFLYGEAKSRAEQAEKYRAEAEGLLMESMPAPAPNKNPMDWYAKRDAILARGGRGE